MSRKVIKETQLGTISLRFMKSLQFHGFYRGEDNDDEDGNELAPSRWNHLPLTDIDPLLRCIIGWQPEEKLLLHSKKVFEDSHSVMWQMSQAQKGK